MTMRIALSGLNAATVNLDVTANNIANSNTTGFKASRASFADVFTTSALGVGSTQVGSGVRLSAISQQFSQGAVASTESGLDLAISGEGFFTLRDASGTTAYTRSGKFSADRDGFVVNSQNQRLQVYPPLPTGGFNQGLLTDLRVDAAQSPPSATSRGEVLINLPANAPVPTVSPFDPNNPQTYNHATSTAVYDSLGNLSTATFFFVKQPAANAWTVAMTIDGTAVGTPVPLSFSASGALTTPANGAVTWPSYTPPTGALPLDITFDFTGSTQFGNQFGVSAITQDGFSSGRLSALDINDTGVVLARFTNGRAVELGQLALSNFANPNGLRQLGDTTWAETFASGDVIRGMPGTASFGLIQASALESSNVDLTKELVNMILAQRSFQANAQVITTGDQIQQTILNIR
ncbi:MAG: flagellar hook protein FlgE [Steroidobacteraceae bacterium]|jgi:flagellar hook protein FlgE|nr:flagellar hook protein FlgE [Steroidobacteraceae bacterium]